MSRRITSLQHLLKEDKRRLCKIMLVLLDGVKPTTDDYVVIATLFNEECAGGAEVFPGVVAAFWMRSSNKSKHSESISLRTRRHRVPRGTSRDGAAIVGPPYFLRNRQIHRISV